MQDYFVNFIILGDPNGEKLPNRPYVNTSNSNPSVMIIDIENESIPADKDERYKFLDEAYGNKYCVFLTFN